MKSASVYKCLVAQMYLKGLDSKELAARTGLQYAALRRKMRGDCSFKLEEAARIRKELDCGMALEELFERKDTLHDA